MPRAKRTPEATDAMRRDLIDAARATIATHGVAGVSARGLAHQLGWAVGTIYTVAPSLEAVTLEANALELRDLQDAVVARQAELDGASPRDRIRALAEVYLRFTQERPRSWAAIFERADVDGEDGPPEWYRDRQAGLFSLLEAELTPLVSCEADARRASRALWAALQGLLALSMGGHLGRVSVDTTEDLASYLLETFLDGLEARQSVADPS